MLDRSSGGFEGIPMFVQLPCDWYACCRAMAILCLCVGATFANMDPATFTIAAASAVAFAIVTTATTPVPTTASAYETAAAAVTAAASTIAAVAATAAVAAAAATDPNASVIPADCIFVIAAAGRRAVMWVASGSNIV